MLSPVPGKDGWDEQVIEAAHSQPAVTSIRLHPGKPSDAAKDCESVPWFGWGKYLPGRPVFTLDPLFHAGAYYVQEASSMFVGHAFSSLLDRKGPLRVLDLCAAPGGKSTLLASLLQEEDLLIANEVIQQRSAILVENMTRWGQMNTWVTHNDAKDFSALKGYFDVVLVDAPCTGSGLWRKDPKAVEEWSVDHVKLCAERQKRIVADVLPALKEGGLLLYATCSYSPEENEMIADWLCDQFAMSTCAIPLDPEWHVQETISPQKGAYGYRFNPWLLKGEGFFLAAFRKEEEEGEPLTRKHGKSAKATDKKGKEESMRWSHWLDTSFTAICKNDVYYAIHPDHREDYYLLHALLRVKKGGTALGKLALRDCIPDHELSLSIHLSADVPGVALSKDEALLYLKKEEVKREHTQKGWQTARYEGLALGWGKWLPNRMNNYLPKHWRIRMDID